MKYLKRVIEKIIKKRVVFTLRCARFPSIWNPGFKYNLVHRKWVIDSHGVVRITLFNRFVYDIKIGDRCYNMNTNEATEKIKYCLRKLNFKWI